MVRQTSIDTYNKIKKNGLLSQRRMEAYDVVFQFGPGTSSELNVKADKVGKSHVFGNLRARLNELRELGCVYEVREKVCPITGMTVIEWDVTDKLPAKWEKPIRHTCKTCGGRGYIEETQGRLFK